jgi:hypothetical protein
MSRGTREPILTDAGGTSTDVPPGRRRAQPTLGPRPVRPVRPRFVLILATGVLGIALLSSTGRAGAAVVSGTAEITAPYATTPLDSGGSATEYGVVLPAAAACPGDTAHQGYRVYSYLVPQNVPLSSLTVKGDAPFRGDAGHPYFGYIAFGEYYGPVNTDLNTGGIPDLPPEFTWSRLTRHDLFANGQTSAVWDGGILCATANGAVTNDWNTAIQFTVSSADPGGFTWKVVNPPSTSFFNGVTIGVALILLSAVVGAFAIIRSRRSGPPPAVEPTSAGDGADPRLTEVSG